MKHSRDLPQFYLTAPSPCPYLPGQVERKVFTHLIGPRAIALNNALSQCGFRRSQSIAYRPACETCRACVSVRIVVDEFKPSKTFRRTFKRNQDLVTVELEPGPTSDQYSLFRTYLDERHSAGGMVDMTVLDYAMMVEDTAIDTRLIEYRVREPGWLETEARHQGALVGVALTDVLNDGLSMVYSFYDPDLQWRSLGTYMILDHIEKVRRMGLPYLYLGYWVPGSNSMGYKGRFLPQERLIANGWVRVER